MPLSYALGSRRPTPKCTLTVPKLTCLRREIRIVKKIGIEADLNKIDFIILGTSTTYFISTQQFRAEKSFEII